MWPHCAQLLLQVCFPGNRQSPRGGFWCTDFREGCTQGSGGEGGDRGRCSLTPGALEREWDHRAGCSIMWSLAGSSSGGWGITFWSRSVTGTKWAAVNREQPALRKLGDGHWPIKGSAWGANSIHRGWRCLLPGPESALSHLPLATRSAPTLCSHGTHPLWQSPPLQAGCLDSAQASLRVLCSREASLASCSFGLSPWIPAMLLSPVCP